MAPTAEALEVEILPKIDVEQTASKIKSLALTSSEVAPLIGKTPVIKSEQDKLAAFSDLQLIKGEYNRLDTRRKSLSDPFRKMAEGINGIFKLVLDPLKTAEEIHKKGIQSWDQAEEKRIAKENERLRQQAQEKQDREKEKLEAKAIKAAEKGETEKAEQLQQKAQEVAAAPVIAPVIQPKKTAGLSYKPKWSAIIVDPKLIPREYLIPDQKKLDAVIHAVNGNIEIPGVRNHEEKVLSSTSR